MLKKIIAVLLGIPLLLLASMHFITLDHVFWWKSSVLATEYGHYLAVLVLIWGVCLPRKMWSVGIQLALIAAFAKPAYRAEKLSANLGQRISYREMYLGYTPHQQPPQTFVYKNVGNTDLRVDFYPTLRPSEKWLLVVHGGGWDSGNRQQLDEWNYLLSQNYDINVFAIDYSLAPIHRWPAARNDVADAIRFVRAHSEKFKINPDKYFLLGRSAGGQLAAAVGYQHKELQLPKPAGVILYYAPTDMTFGYEVAEPHDLIESRSLIRNFMGGEPEEKATLYQQASPTELVSTDSPPTLMLHGRPDNLSWFKHSDRLARRLRGHKVPHEFVELPWAVHGFDFNPYGPGGQIARFALSKFIK